MRRKGEGHKESVAVMKTSIDLYLQWLDELAGVKGQYHLITEKTERPPLWVIIYKDIPDPSSILAFTYGLSSIEHPDWKFGRPELMICVDSENINWGLAIGHLAKSFRGKCSFTYGTILRFGEMISEESGMNAFFVFAPSIIDPKNACIQLPDRTINLVQMYPIYEDEADLIKSKGIDRFLDEVSDIYSVSRKSIRKR